MTPLIPKPLACEEIVQRLWPYLDGALLESERGRVIAHLEECDGCRSHYDFAESFLEAVRASAPAPGEFEALRARVGRAVAEHPMR